MFPRAQLAIQLLVISLLASYTASSRPLMGAPHFEAPFYSFPAGSAPTKLEAHDLDHDGVADVVVNQSTGLAVLRARGDGTLEPPRNLAVGGPVSLFTLVDTNSDGELDVILARHNQIGVLLGTGTGEFLGLRTSLGGSHPVGLATADWNGDGVIDVALIESGKTRGTPSFLFLGLGDGTFRSGPNTTFLGNAKRILGGDFNEDGNEDLVTVVDYFVPPDIEPPSRLALQIGNGDGTFGSAMMFTVGYHPWDAVAADFDTDGHLDLVVSYAGWRYQLAGERLFLGDGLGGFRPSIEILGALDYSPAAGTDLNGDERPDLLYDGGGAELLLNLPGQPVYFKRIHGPRMGWQTSSVVAGDVTSDGLVDFIAVDPMYNAVTVSPQRVDGSFAPAGVAGGRGGLGMVTVHDINADGWLDLTYLEPGSLTTFLAIPGGGYRHYERVSPQPLCTEGSGGIVGLAAGDLDGDGRPSLMVTTCRTSLGARIFLYEPPYEYQWDVYSIPNRGSLSVHDFNRDEKPDVMLVTGSIYLIEGRGNEAPPLGATTRLGPGVHVQAIDFDSDGDLDVVSDNPAPSDVAVILYRGRGDFTFAPEETLWVGNVIVKGLNVGDYTGDGNLDVALALEDAGSWSVRVLADLGNGRFETVSEYSMPYLVGQLVGGDFDADGDLDCAVVQGRSEKASESPLIVSVLVNDGDGSFGNRFNYGVHSTPDKLIAVDIDRDMDVDLVVGIGTGVTILRNVSQRPTPVTQLWVEAEADGVRISWSLGFRPVELIVQRSRTTAGPWVDVARSRESNGTYIDVPPDPGLEFAYRLLLRGTDGAVWFVGPRTVLAPESSNLTIELRPIAQPVSGQPVRILFDVHGRSTMVRLGIYDVRGGRVWQESWTLVRPGLNERRWDASQVPRGIYFVRLEAGSSSIGRKFVLLRP